MTLSQNEWLWTLPPSITEGARFVMPDVPGERVVICADSVAMLQPDDAGQIAITASRGALSGGRPDNAIPRDISVFHSEDPPNRSLLRHCGAGTGCTVTR
jgi:hypothetical protein